MKLPLSNVRSVNSFMATNFVLSLTPVHSCSSLCCLTQAREQVFFAHFGHVYFANLSVHT